MKSLILYDSMGGNTEKVAQTIEQAVRSWNMECRLEKVRENPAVDVYDYDLVFIGSPVIDWLPTPPLMTFVKNKMKEYVKKGLIKPSSPIIPGRFGISFGTYAGPHIGINEASPMTLWLNSFLEHLGYTTLDQWLVVGEHHHMQHLNTHGRLGNIQGRPDARDLSSIAHRVNGVIEQLSAWNPRKPLDTGEERSHDNQ